MPKQENTAINHLVGYTSRRPIDDIDEPALFRPAPPAARRRPPPVGANLSPVGAPVAPLPRRRAPAATPPQVPLHSDYADDAATTVDPPAHWGAQPIAQPTPPPLPPMPTMPPALPVPTWAAVQPARPPYPAPHQPPAYYQAPYPDQTMRVQPMPLEAEKSLGVEILEWVAKLWMPFVALGVLAMTLGVYRLLNDKTEPPPITSEPAIAMTAAPMATAAAEPVAAEPVAAEPVVVEPVAAEPVAADDHGVPKDSLWQPTKAQPTFAPRVETVAAIEPEPAIEIEPATAEPAVVEPTRARKPAARASSDRSSSRRAAKRAAAKRASEQRAKQLALAELAPTRKDPPKAAKPETSVVAIAAAKPMKIGAASAASATGSGRLTVASTPSTLIYVDGRNTGMMTPKTLSLSEGSHKITLLSPKDRIAKTIAVEIEAGKSASLSKNFTK